LDINLFPHALYAQFYFRVEIIGIMGAGGFIIGLIIHLWGDPGELDIAVNNVRFNGPENSDDCRTHGQRKVITPGLIA